MAKGISPSIFILPVMKAVGPASSPFCISAQSSSPTLKVTAGEAAPLKTTFRSATDPSGLVNSTVMVPRVELTNPDGSQADLKVVFNGASSPEVTFKIGLEDWVLVQKGELPGPTAFMTGKMKIEGDMPFAMALGNLMA